jgi:enterochelin esterase-like enzyme
MNTKILITLLLTILNIKTQLLFAQLNINEAVKLSSGTLYTLPINSKYVPNRPVEVWVPNILLKANEKYKVIYMHDGQMLFDSTNTWNHKEWQVDETIAKLLQQNKTAATIIVAIHNIPRLRYAELLPAFIANSHCNDSLVKTMLSDSTNADNYLKFITEEIMPAVNKNFNTYTNAENTFIAGSSMGGLNSWYALLKYPTIFGGAICMSTHWPGANPNNKKLADCIFSNFKNYINNNSKALTNKILYMDYGTQTLDSHYEPYQKAIDKLIKQKKVKGLVYYSSKFKGDAHDEVAWAKRLPTAFSFILNSIK